jgi:hypothetical protein
MRLVDGDERRPGVRQASQDGVLHELLRSQVHIPGLAVLDVIPGPLNRGAALPGVDGDRTRRTGIAQRGDLILLQGDQR